MLKVAIQFTLVAALLLLVWWGPGDQRANEALEGGLERALVTFALARTLNGVISVAQGTELAMQPAGVGLTVAVGELLDPVNDLVERFSWVMLLSATSIGMQRLLLELSVWWGMSALFSLAAIGWLLARGQRRPWRVVTTRALLFVMLLRLALPFSLVLGQWVHDQFLEQRYEQSTAAVEQTTERLRAFEPTETAPTLFDRIVGDADLLPDLDQIADVATDLVGRLIDLIVLFLMETVVLPLLFIWTFWHASRLLLSVRHLRPAKPADGSPASAD